MGLADIASGLEVTAEQQERGVATTDATETPLAERLAPFAERLPCSATAAATLVEAYADGASVGRAAAVAELPKTTAAKALYLLGEPIEPVSPTARRVLEDWLAGDLSRTEAKRLAGVGDRAFALGTYVATHEPIAAAEAAVADELSVSSPADPLSDTRSDLGDLV
ncbi:uncharacterized protein NP_5094A [Natronomonas pharaonis DSM 2160]|uniref:Uncharacterized protein n=1 Tax=Natronomonas pharaonis (strain ATCC 35678 / DSM 2160 / CIP 103997 / JCM 8858 / NBRC 14720 / NCIMB 2260 / Gabara) TaxID=348780 RepID=A0A1U7EZA3_NATPD|nr:hypothetical protein [Natronomonas pharaonis]CAI50638.1 uncharacterized protein NP_5094A [Natronomonas pharaonis DSM 2160]